jgi:membrane protease YdiL (CAAX protease family)
MILPVLLLGPTLMIAIGLYGFQSVPITFLLFYGWLLFIPIITTRKINVFSHLQENRINKVHFGYALASGVICLLALVGSVTILLQYLIDVTALQLLLREWGFSGEHVIILLLVLLIINPVFEEMYWRGFLYNRLLPKVGVTGAVLTTAVFYSLYHLLSVIPMFSPPLNIVAILPVLFAGFLWGYFRYKFGNVIGAIISHCLADLGIILVYDLYIS